MSTAGSSKEPSQLPVHPKPATPNGNGSTQQNGGAFE